MPRPIFDRVLLDPGHGGLIDGTYQTRGKQYTFTDVEPEVTVYEGVLNRSIAARLACLLRGARMEVHDVVTGSRIDDWPTPDSWDPRDTPLPERVAYANELRQGALYISIHANAIGNESRGPSKPARGVSVFTSVGHTMADVVATSIYRAFSEMMEELPVRPGDWSDGDVDHEANFYVLRKTRMPAVLVEGGFFTNRKDATYLSSTEGADQVARAYFMGILPFLGRSGAMV